MVLKHSQGFSLRMQAFENDVKMYGTQARESLYFAEQQFENDVKMYGTQAVTLQISPSLLFENDVKMYGTQAGTGEWIK